jgi:hypothetical protein
MPDIPITPHMEVIGSDGGHVGTVDRLEPGHLKLTREDDPAGLGGHRMIPLSAIAEVEPGRVRLRLEAAKARAMAAGGGHPDRMEEGLAERGRSGEARDQLTGNIHGGGTMAQRAGTGDAGSPGGGEGFPGDPNMDPSGRGRV